MEKPRLHTPLDCAATKALRAGDQVLLFGPVYTARDAAHIRIKELLCKGLPLPFELLNAVIYYTGPTPTPPGLAIGSAGPTTSYRMDSFTPELHRAGLAATIGKGKRSEAVRLALRETGRVYFGATGGAAALLAQHIRSCEVIAFPELGTEAVRRLVVEDFPLLVVYDAHGNSVFPGDPRLS